jgi:hypothetical protein
VTTTTTPKKKAPVPAILKFGSAYNTQEHVASELKTASANATTRNLSLIVCDLAAALAAQADVPFDRATRLAVRRACVRVSSEGGRSRRRARGGGQHAVRSGRTVGTVMFFQSFVFCFPINNDFFLFFFLFFSYSI